MKKHERQEAAYEFLRTCGPNGEFKLSALVAATDWSESTAKTHIGKHYRDWGLALPSGKFKVLPEFQRITKEQFLKHCSQIKRVFTDYVVSQYSALSVFEFLLPMSRETQLRATLDGLFYADMLEQRFDELGAPRLEALMPRKPKEPDSEYRTRWIAQVSNWFGGYSISLVNGRFRAASLRTRKAAVEHQAETGRPYLIDETTASVRFIVPIPASKAGDGTLDFSQTSTAIAEDARRIRGLFFAVFVEAVIRIVNGEDVIWLLEDSPLGRYSTHGSTTEAREESAHALHGIRTGSEGRWWTSAVALAALRILAVAPSVVGVVHSEHLRPLRVGDSGSSIS